MAATVAQLQKKIRELKKEVKTLQESCDSLQQTQSSYEQIIGDNNSSLLRADMASMELEQVFSAYTDATWVLKEDGSVIRVNNAMLKMLDKTDYEVIGKKCFDLIDYHLCDKLNCPRVGLKRQPNKEIDITLEREGSNQHYLLTAAQLITIDGSPGCVVQFKDITDRKEAEEELEKANATLERLALVDGLTQIANRRSFDETLNKEWLRLRRSSQPISLLLGDIDFFKKYNDHYGHQAGDDCLKEVGSALSKSVLRPADLAARYGGEEFALLLPEVETEGAVLVGERALKGIAGLKIPHQQSDVSDHVSISIGVATLVPSQDLEPKDLIALADEALYTAKEQGRNRIYAHEPDQQDTESASEKHQ